MLSGLVLMYYEGIPNRIQLSEALAVLLEDLRPPRG